MTTQSPPRPDTMTTPTPPRGSKRPRTPASRPTTGKGKAMAKKKARGRSTIWDDPDRLMSDPKSPIYKANVNLKALLIHPLATTALAEMGKLYDFASLNCDDFATAVANFKEDGRCGRHDPEWVRQAMEASSRRAAGEFDEYVRAKFEEMWGVPWEGKEDGWAEAEGESGGNGDLEMRDGDDHGDETEDDPDQKDEQTKAQQMRPDGKKYLLDVQKKLHDEEEKGIETNGAMPSLALFAVRETKTPERVEKLEQVDELPVKATMGILSGYGV